MEANDTPHVNIMITLKRGESTEVTPGYVPVVVLERAPDGCIKTELTDRKGYDLEGVDEIIGYAFYGEDDDPVVHRMVADESKHSGFELVS